jgi:hypothetical protein
MLGDWFPLAYYGTWVLSLCCSSLLLAKCSNASNSTHNAQHTKDTKDKEFAAFQNNYLTVYLIMIAADWFQGPYMYALYQLYGFSIQQIGTLFLLGFAASLVSGPIVGAAADKL